MLLESEKKAIALFQKKGREECNCLLNEITIIANKRYENAPSIPKDWTPIDFLTTDEKETRYVLILALTLCTNPQQEAHERVMQRLRERNAKI